MSRVNRRQVRVWDIPTRAFHWTLASSFIFLIISGDQGWMEWHFKAGYLLSALVIFRLFWGVLGSRYARFKSFAFSPSTTFSYIKGLLTGQHQNHYGHNPAGALMVFALLVLLLVQAFSGMVISDEIMWEGPFYNSVPESINELGGMIHEPLQGFLQFMIVAHILAIAFHRFKFGEHLVRAMIHGRKPQVEPVEQRDSVSMVKLAIAVIPAMAWLWYLLSIPV